MTTETRTYRPYIPSYEERSIVDEAKLGSPEAMGRIYERYHTGIFGYVLSCVGSIHEAEDITSTVFLKTIEGLPRFTWKNVPFSAWLYRIARNEVIDNKRRSSKRGTRSISVTYIKGPANDMRPMGLDENVLPDILDTQSKTPEEIAISNEESSIVREAVGKLSPMQKAIIEKRYFQDQSVKTTALDLGTSENSTKVSQNKAIKRLGKIIDPQRILDTG